MSSRNLFFLKLRFISDKSVTFAYREKLVILYQVIHTHALQPVMSQIINIEIQMYFMYNSDMKTFWLHEYGCPYVTNVNKSLIQIYFDATKHYYFMS